jgi:hypothetical protein
MKKERENANDYGVTNKFRWGSSIGKMPTTTTTEGRKSFVGGGGGWFRRSLSWKTSEVVDHRYVHSQTLIAVCRSESPSPHYPTRHNFFFVSFVFLFFFLADEDQILFFPTNACTTDDGGGGFLYVHALGCSCGWI